MPRKLYYIKGHDQDGKLRQSIGPLSPLYSREGWTQRHRDEHRRMNRRDVEVMRASGLTVSLSILKF